MSNTFTRSRDGEFVEICRNILRELPERQLMPAKTLAQLALRVRPRHFYASEASASKVYAAYLLGRVPDKDDGFWIDFCRNVDAVLRQRPWLDPAFGLRYTLAFRRPTSFHISLRSAMRIIQKHLRPSLEP